jgi:NAD(P)-dependent dehydrogenase (short-subunit alcohol dehydrogenase family)
MRYQQEKDYGEWEKRLYLVECDFTSSTQVDKLISLVKEKFSKLDILINNAAQTIVRPK